VAGRSGDVDLLRRPRDSAVGEPIRRVERIVGTEVRLRHDPLASTLEQQSYTPARTRRIRSRTHDNPRLVVAPTTDTRRKTDSLKRSVSASEYRRLTGVIPDHLNTIRVYLFNDPIAVTASPTNKAPFDEIIWHTDAS
jgi:hypothetical protein